MKYVRQYKGKKVIYDIEMSSPDASQTVRDTFGLFWRKRSGRRLPDDLKGISFSNAVSFPTRVRIRLLKELCRRHQQANPTLSCFVTSYLARPELKIRDRRGLVTSLTYTEAVQQLSHHLTHDFLRELFLFAKTNLPEREVVERFLVLSPDLLTDSQVEPMAVDEPQALLPPQVQEQAVQNQFIIATAPSTPQPNALASATSHPNTVHFSSPSASIQASVPTTSTFAPPITASASSPSPTFATLTNVVVTPPLVTSQASLPGTIDESVASDGDFTVVHKRNRSRFAKKSVPYPINH
jgi:hypothetical protein